MCFTPRQNLVRNITVVPHDVVDIIVNDLVAVMNSRNGHEFHVALTGGRAGGLISQQFLERPEVASNKMLHIWWSDERYVNRDDELRNDFVVNTCEIAGRIHSVNGPDSSSSIEDSALAYSTQLHQFTTTRFCAYNTLMDVTLLSIGPDGHIASLFPHSPQLDATAGIIAITDSPKPPAHRVTWTFPTINASEQVWLFATGEEKRHAVSQVIANVDVHDIPAAGARGKKETRLYLDTQASSL